MAEKEVIVLCYWNGYIKYGLNGVYYEGSTPQNISVKQKTEFRKLVEGLHIITRLHNFRIIGRYPVVVSPNQFRYIPLPVVSDSSLEKMLDVPSNHPSLNFVELYLEVDPTCDDVINPAACSDNPGSNSSKRQRTQVDGYVDTVVKLETDNGLAVQRLNNNNVPGLNKIVGLSASKPRLSSLWVNDDELRLGLCFKDKDELKKAVDWCAIRGGQKCVVHETKKDEYKFECIRWKCDWSLCATKMEEHGLVEITKCSGPHTCCPTLMRPDNFDSKFTAAEIECLIRVQPTLTIDELNNWWFEKYSYRLGTSEMKAAKQEVIRKNIRRLGS